MRRTLTTLLTASLMLGAATTASAEDGDARDASNDLRRERIADRIEQRGDRVERRLDNRGDRIDRRLDRRGEDINRRLDRRGQRAARRHDRRADRVRNGGRN
jgi:Ni/Co efflux regulator RcnB